MIYMLNIVSVFMSAGQCGNPEARATPRRSHSLVGVALTEAQHHLAADGAEVDKNGIASSFPAVMTRPGGSGASGSGWRR